MNVRKWAIPLTCVGLGAIFLSKRGRKILSSAANRISVPAGRLAAWNDAAQDELHHIQQEVKDIEHLLGTHIAQ